jgi:rhodanese-related sulfurtransferase
MSVYCRSVRRSKIAAGELVKLGYANVKEFGGTIDWEYEIVK